MTFIVIVGLLILVGLSVFQFLLIIGKPLGDYAWGGQRRVLPKKLRIASVFSIFLYLVFVLFLISKAGMVNVIIDATVVNVGMWIFTIYFTVGIFVNAISRSKKERMLMTPVAASLAVVFAVATLAQ